ncbi:Ger(x)C family spore germination protein [Sporomusa rhizae]|uniref:Ger(x)C family spore germination protein n=1 Tax=Sporomusa rhizae TaxID=357999 RepID=UPI003529D549
MRAKKRLVGVLIMVAIALTISGCWDRRELQDRNFVMAVAIDTADAGQRPGEGKKEAKTETFVQPNGVKRYRVSLQILKIAKGGGGGQGSSGQTSGGQGGGGGKTYVISNTGQSLFEVVRDMLGQSNKSLYFEHIQAIIISEAAVREMGVKPIIDFFLRDAEMRWRIRLYVTPGEARPLIEYVPPSKEAGGIFLANIARNHIKDMHIAAARIDLGNVGTQLDNKMDIAIPRIEMAGNVVKVRGAALFKKDKFVGYIDERAVAGVRMVRVTEKSGIITVPGDREGDVIAFELIRHDTQLVPHVDGDNIYFTLDINMWGNLGEYQAMNRVSSADDPEFVRRVEQKVAEEVKRTVLYGKNSCQSLGVDMLYFSRKLKLYYPKTWDKIKDNWDEIYPNVPLVVSVNVVINQAGEHK